MPHHRGHQSHEHAIKQAKEFANMGVEIKTIPVERMALLVFHDAAWGNLLLWCEKSLCGLLVPDFSANKARSRRPC